MDSPVRRSFSSHCNPHRFLQPEVLRFSFPVLKPCLTPQLFLLAYPHENVGWPSPPVPASPAQSAGLPCVFSALLPISTPSTSMDECFFNSWVVGLPWSLIFWQFWLFFVFKLVVILLLVVQGSEVFLPMPPSWLEALLSLFYR